ncbi:hypothetical protein FisN_11Lh022 [Fistulifera solaris]|uniref:Rab-GAP TBC domain-containing protein n=1 Tax=Fistulifera solaris TaxID=1519565 RepID=A0A1Z5J7K7_FISSO|nr:hypothetical protein FisN_11Lh022 [Fistulifera solaris]|eukprot:GAX09985.1 hypothetical protein FisN_11Lh022 [Fistulifera solaris]
MSSFITDYTFFAASAAHCSTDDEGVWTDFSKSSTSEPEGPKNVILPPYPNVRGRILETVPMRQLTGKHKRKEEMIQKQLAHRKRSSSEPPPLERTECENDCTCTDVSNRRLSTPSPFFSRLAKVKHMQQELREQQRLTHLNGPVPENKNGEISSSPTTNDNDPSADTIKKETAPTEHGKDENRDIRLNIVKRRGGSLLKSSNNEGRQIADHDPSKTKDANGPVATKSIPLAKLREHRRRKLGIVTATPNEFNQDNMPTNSQSSDSLGSLITASTAVLESAGVPKLGKASWQSSESLGSLETASLPLSASELGVITYNSVAHQNRRKNAIISHLDSNITDPDSDSKDYIVSNTSSQASESLGSLETASTPSTERGEITYSTSTDIDGDRGGLDSATETTNSYPTWSSESQTQEMPGFEKWATFENNGTNSGSSSSAHSSHGPYGKSTSSETDIFNRIGDQSFEVSEKMIPLRKDEQIDLEGETGNDNAELTGRILDEDTKAPLALSAQGPGKSFDFREIEDTENVFVDPSWDAFKVYFNEFDDAKKNNGDDMFGIHNDDWISTSRGLFSLPVQATECDLDSDAMFPRRQQVEEEKKDRDSVSVEQALEIGLVNSDSKFVDLRWSIVNECTGHSTVSAGPLSKESEADHANLLDDSSSGCGSSRDSSNCLPKKKEERIREYNTLEVDEESSEDDSGSEQTEQDDYLPNYVPQANPTDDDILSSSEDEDLGEDFKTTEGLQKATSDQSDVFDFASDIPGSNSRFLSDENPNTAHPLSGVAQLALNVSNNIDQPLTSLEERESLVKPLSIPLVSIPVPPPPPPSPRTSTPKKARRSSKVSNIIPRIAPPPFERMKKWEEEKARPIEHLKKLQSRNLLPPPPPPPPPPKSLFHRGRPKRSSDKKQAVESKGDCALSSTIISNVRMAEKVDTAISVASSKFEEQISGEGFANTFYTNGRHLESLSQRSFGNSKSRLSTAADGEGLDHFDFRRQNDHLKSERSPFNEAIIKVPALLSKVLEFLGDPVAVCRVKMLNRGCREYVERSEHLLMREAVRLGGMSMQVRPAFWLWVTLEKMDSAANNRDAACVEELERQGREGKWHSVIERDVARAFGNLPPHKSGARLRTDSIVRALVSWGRGRMIKRGVKGDGEAPPHLTTSNSYDSDVTPTDTVSDWGAVAPASSTASELDESLRFKQNNEILSKHDDGRGELALSGSVLRDDLKVELRGKLRFVLHALAASHPDVGYCQGMDYVVAHLLRILQETIRWKAAVGTLPEIIESAPQSIGIDGLSQEALAKQYCKIDQTFVVEETLFHVMESFFGTYNLRHFYYPELRCLKTCCRVFERLIQLKLPVLADHFEHHELNVGLFALGWFQTLFLYLPSMPSATVCHMWDIWLVERSFKIFFRVGTAILFLSQPILLNHELEGMMSYLNTFPDATLLSPDILIACALQIKVTNKLLMELEREVIRTM